jgi:hypothetical protein
MCELPKVMFDAAIQQTTANKDEANRISMDDDI